jgi:CubicO group peptidase (beta-lactamase class C family)
LLAAYLAGSAVTAQEPTARVDAVFADLDRQDSPGCVVGVFHDGEVLHSKGYGKANLEHGIPLLPESVVGLASESKQFVAALVTKEVGVGRLSLDDDVRKYVPELPDYGKTITIRHLLHHTSGLRDYSTLWLMAGQQDSDAHTAELTLDLLARQRELNFSPGTDCSYTNSGYFLLGIVLERVSGKTLQELAAEKLFEPARMGDTRFRDDRHQLVERRASGHFRRAGGFGRQTTNSQVVGAGGLLTTLEDLFQWERYLLEAELGKKSLLDQLVERGVLNDGTELHYARGLVVDDFDGMTTVTHGGTGDGFRSMILRFPELRLTVSSVCNFTGFDLPSRVWRTAIVYLYGPLAERTTALQQEPPPIEWAELSTEQLRARAGAFRNVKTRAIWRASVREQGLVFETGRGVSAVRPVGDRRFRTEGYGPVIVVEFGEGDAANTMRVETEAQEPMLFERVKIVSREPVELQEYAGEYYSDELRIPWILVVRDGTLFFDGPGASEAPLTPTIADEFALGAELVVRFFRQDGKIQGLTAHNERVRSLAFRRERSPR